MARGLVTNACLQSESISTSPWAFYNSQSLGTYGGTKPTGVTAMQTLSDVATGSVIHQLQQIAQVSSRYVVFSCYIAKVAGTGWTALEIAGGTGASYAFFNVGTGAVGTTYNVIAANIEATNVTGMYRCSICVKANKSSITVYVDTATGNGTSVYSTAGSQEQLAVGGMMLENAVWGQTTPSPYVLTAAATATIPRDYRQNLVNYSEDLSKSSWVTLNATATANQGTASVGTYTLLTDDSTNSEHFTCVTKGTISNSLDPVPIGTQATVVIRAKAGTKNWFCIKTNNSNAGGWVNLTTGALGTTFGGATFRIYQVLANEWVIVMTWTVTSISASARYIAFHIANADNATTYLGAGTGTLYLAGAQLIIGNNIPDYKAVTSASSNPSGAPRLVTT